MRPYHPYAPDQAFLLPQSLLDLIRADDPVHVVRRAVGELDLGAIHRAYRAERGRPPYHRAAMVGLLLYGACRGIYSSRRLEAPPKRLLPVVPPSTQKGVHFLL